MYDGHPMQLSEGAEEAAGFFAKMLDHDYTTKDIFCQNFFADWRKVEGYPEREREREGREGRQRVDMAYTVQCDLHVHVSIFSLPPLPPFLSPSPHRK